MLTPDELKKRKEGIGGSDAAAIMGMDKYRSPLDIYLDKISLKTISVDNEYMYWGSVLETKIIERYEKDNHLIVDTENVRFIHPGYPFLMGTLDGVVNGDTVLEIKTASSHLKHLWGEPYTDDIPLNYYMQCLHYMLITGFKKCNLAVLIGGNDYRVYQLKYDAEIADDLIRKEIKFWNENVQKNIPPKPETLDDIKKLYPESTDNEMPLTANLATDIKAFLELGYDIASLESQQDVVKLKIQNAMRNNSAIVNTVGQVPVTWRTGKPVHRFDSKALEKIEPNIYNQFIKVSPGMRRFVVKNLEGKK